MHKGVIIFVFICRKLVVMMSAMHTRISHLLLSNMLNMMHHTGPITKKSKLFLHCKKEHPSQKRINFMAYLFFVQYYFCTVILHNILNCYTSIQCAIGTPNPVAGCNKHVAYISGWSPGKIFTFWWWDTKSKFIWDNRWL